MGGFSIIVHVMLEIWELEKKCLSHGRNFNIKASALRTRSTIEGEFLCIFIGIGIVKGKGKGKGIGIGTGTYEVYNFERSESSTG